MQKIRVMLAELLQKTEGRREHAKQHTQDSDAQPVSSRDAYGETEYWEQRYAQEDTLFDWLVGWGELEPLLQQERAARHVKGAGAVLKGDQKMRVKKAAMRVTSTEGVYVGRVVASFGQDKLEVLLHDGREVRCKAAGRLRRERVRLRVGDAVRVKYNLDVDEDGQTPSIIGLDIDE